jgi:hypothetical protein
LYINVLVKKKVPKINPTNDPTVQKRIECHSTLIFMKMMQNPPLAVPAKYLPHLHISIENKYLNFIILGNTKNGKLYQLQL